MPKGSVPLNPLAAGGQQPPVMQAPVPMLPRMTPEMFGKRGGPLGMRELNPETIAKIGRLQKEMANTATGAIQVTAPGEPPSEGPPVPTSAASSPIPPTPVLPSAPAPTAYGQPQPPTQPDQSPIPEPPEPPPSVAQADGVYDRLRAMASSGAENRIYKNKEYDAEISTVTFWKSSPERRKIIESRCKPIDWSSLFTNYEIRQETLLWKVPEDTWVSFRTMSADDELLVRELLWEKYSSEASWEVGVVLTTCAAGLISIGKMTLPPVPPVIGSDKDDRKKIMKERIDRIVRIPYPLLTDLAINYAWFVMRVNRAQREGDLGNG